MQRKSKIISVRVNPALYEFLKRITDERNKGITDFNNRYTIGDTVRHIIQHFSMSYILGEYKKPLSELRREFISFLDSLEEAKKKGLKKVDSEK